MPLTCARAAAAAPLCGRPNRLTPRLREEMGLTYAVDAALALYADAGTLAIDLAVAH